MNQACRGYSFGSLFSVFLLLCSLTFSSFAVTLFEQPPDPRVHPGISSSLGFDGASAGRRTADDFSLSADAVVNEIVWWGQHAPPSSKRDDFVATFYGEKDAFPGPLIVQSRGKLTSAPHPSIPALTEYRIVLSCPLHAKAGTRYWLSIFNAESGAAWRWNNSVVGNNSSVQTILPAESQWKAARGEALDTSFRLGAVPLSGSCRTSYWMPVLGVLAALAFGIWIFFRLRDK